MGFYGPTIILNDDVQISGTFTYDIKISNIGEYLESDGYEVIAPTTEICKYFKDRIKYTFPSIKCFCVLNSRLEVWNQLPNLHVFTSKNDVIEYLEAAILPRFLAPNKIKSGNQVKQILYKFFLEMFKY
jgi:hypothetical protein